MQSCADWLPHLCYNPRVMRHSRHATLPDAYPGWIGTATGWVQIGVDNDKMQREQRNGKLTGTGGTDSISARYKTTWRIDAGRNRDVGRS